MASSLEGKTSLEKGGAELRGDVKDIPVDCKTALAELNDALKKHGISTDEIKKRFEGRSNDVCYNVYLVSTLFRYLYYNNAGSDLYLNEAQGYAMSLFKFEKMNFTEIPFVASLLYYLSKNNPVIYDIEYVPYLFPKTSYRLDLGREILVFDLFFQVICLGLNHKFDVCYLQNREDYYNKDYISVCIKKVIKPLWFLLKQANEATGIKMEADSIIYGDKNPKFYVLGLFYSRLYILCTRGLIKEEDIDFLKDDMIKVLSIFYKFSNVRSSSAMVTYVDKDKSLAGYYLRILYLQALLYRHGHKDKIVSTKLQVTYNDVMKVSEVLAKGDYYTKLYSAVNADCIRGIEQEMYDSICSVLDAPICSDVCVDEEIEDLNSEECVSSPLTDYSIMDILRKDYCNHINHGPNLRLFDYFSC